jgi:hypothetical protein
MIAIALLLACFSVDPPPPELVQPAPIEPAPIEPAPAEPAPPSYNPVQLEQALARLPVGPTLAETQAAALARAGLDPDPSARWIRRARTAAALPIVSVQWDRRLDRGWTLDQAVGEADALKNDAGNQDVLRAKATWELDRLVFAPDELRAARAVLDMADARERLLVEVTQLYFERERILLERELAPPVDLESAIALRVRLRELEGVLSGLTGLEFDSSSPPPAHPSARRDLATEPHE